MLVKLTYFKISGKYYSESSYITHNEHLFQIWNEVEQKLSIARLPGLMVGHSPFHVLVDVPKHPHQHPHLILAI